MIVVKTGQYGKYYTSAYNTSEPLGEEYQQVNATYIKNYLLDKGWTINAIAGILGNMQAESSINPGRWQSDIIGDGGGGGFGLVQWTPYTKYTNWVTENNLGEANNMDNSLGRIIYELENGLQWIETNSYPLSFREFSTSNLTPSYLAAAFVINYERPKDQSQEVQNYRGSLANNWYTYITGGLTPPIDPDIPVDPDNPITITRKRKHFNFILFNRKRREHAIKRRF